MRARREFASERLWPVQIDEYVWDGGGGSNESVSGNIPFANAERQSIPDASLAKAARVLDAILSRPLSMRPEFHRGESQLRFAIVAEYIPVRSHYGTYSDGAM